MPLKYLAHNALRKFDTAGGVLRSEGIRGIALVLKHKLASWWDRDHPTIGKLIELSGDRVTIDGCRFSLASPSIATPMKSRFVLNQYERPERQAIKHYLDPSIPVVEFGACIGVVSCLTNKKLDHPRQHVVVEANPNLIPLLNKNREANHCEFTVLHRAVGYGSKEIEFHLGGTFVTGRVHREAGERLSVPAVSLKEILDQHGLEFCTLICDIEGQEINLVKHEADTLSNRVKTIIIEIHEMFVGVEAIEGMLLSLERSGFDIVEKIGITYILQNRTLADRPSDRSSGKEGNR